MGVPRPPWRLSLELRNDMYVCLECIHYAIADCVGRLTPIHSVLFGEWFSDIVTPTALVDVWFKSRVGHPYDFEFPTI